MTVFLNGELIPEPGSRGQRVEDDSFLVVFNAHYESLDVTIPAKDYGAWWVVVIDTGDDSLDHSDGGDTYAPGDVLPAEARSVVVLRATPPEDGPRAQATTARSSSGSVPPPTPALRRRHDDPAPAPARGRRPRKRST